MVARGAGIAVSGIAGPPARGGQAERDEHCWIRPVLAGPVRGGCAHDPGGRRRAGRVFPAEIWYPAAARPAGPAARPLVGAVVALAEQAHIFTRGLALAHLDAMLRRRAAAGRFLAGDAESALAAHGVEAFAYPP
jgi:hypothetical protein